VIDDLLPAPAQRDQLTDREHRQPVLADKARRLFCSGHRAVVVH